MRLLFVKCCDWHTSCDKTGETAGYQMCFPDLTLYCMSSVDVSPDPIFTNRCCYISSISCGCPCLAKLFNEPEACLILTSLFLCRVRILGDKNAWLWGTLALNIGMKVGVWMCENTVRGNNLDTYASSAYIHFRFTHIMSFDFVLKNMNKKYTLIIQYEMKCCTSLCKLHLVSF